MLIRLLNTGDLVTTTLSSVVIVFSWYVLYSHGTWTVDIKHSLTIQTLLRKVPMLFLHLGMHFVKQTKSYICM